MSVVQFKNDIISPEFSFLEPMHDPIFCLLLPHWNVGFTSIITCRLVAINASGLHKIFILSVPKQSWFVAKTGKLSDVQFGYKEDGSNITFCNYGLRFNFCLKDFTRFTFIWMLAAYNIFVITLYKKWLCNAMHHFYHPVLYVVNNKFCTHNNLYPATWKFLHHIVLYINSHNL